MRRVISEFGETSEQSQSADGTTPLSGMSDDGGQMSRDNGRIEKRRIKRELNYSTAPLPSQTPTITNAGKYDAVFSHSTIKTTTGCPRNAFARLNTNTRRTRYRANSR